MKPNNQDQEKVQAQSQLDDEHEVTTLGDRELEIVSGGDGIVCW